MMPIATTTMETIIVMPANNKNISINDNINHDNENDNNNNDNNTNNNQIFDKCAINLSCNVAFVAMKFKYFYLWQTPLF